VSQTILSLPRRTSPWVFQLVPSGRSVAIGLALVLGAVGTYGLARETSMFAVRTVEVQGASPAVAAQVRAALRSFDGTSLLTLNGSSVLQRVESLPTVFTATYDRDFPHRLRLRIVPELPVAVLRRGVSSWLVSARGRVIATTDRTRFRRLPRIWLPATSEIDIGAVLAVSSGGVASRAVAVFSSAGVADRVAWARARDGVLTIGLRTGLLLRFGPPTDLALKIAIAREIVPTVLRPSAGGPSYLDLSVPGRPVAGGNSQVEG
jgi:cell division septal protein FtsQ